MNINIFKKVFLVPPKCGSRFFEEHFENREHIPLFKLKDSKFIDEIKFIVLREPFEHMISAIHTEFINFWNNGDKRGNLTEKDVMNFIINYDEHAHWHPHLFLELYLFILKFKKPPTIIMLNDLNDFVKNKLNKTYSTGFTKTKYDFSEKKTYISKDDLWDIYIKKNYPKEWEMFSKLVERDMFFYNKLIELCPKYYIKNLI